MQNLTLHFNYPWLLLLFIPALALTLIPYFRLNKRYRKTRNRITSIVLHLVVMVLAISALAGLRFDYEVPNTNNEIILLVDVSETEEQSAEQRDNLVEIILEDSAHDNFNVGIVTFGFDQEYAVPLTSKVSSVYDKYLTADLPDTSATNIAAALRYAQSLFNNAETGKIVLITDAKETDEKAANAIKSIVAQGTRVDVAYVPSQYEGDDLQIVDVAMPDYHVNEEEDCFIELSIYSTVETSGMVMLNDTNAEGGVNNRIATFDFIQGFQTVMFPHSFVGEGLHDLVFSLQTGEDLLAENNQFSTHFYLEIYNNILILESIDDQSVTLESILNEEVDGEKPYQIKTLNIKTEVIPTTVDELRAYDQVILNNIAAADMPLDFDVILREYVEEYGGGVFTVGGNDDKGNAHTYNRLDMRSKPNFHEMLPIQAIDYTPPVGVIFLIDRSGSMGLGDSENDNRLAWARAAASACVPKLSERDYIGVMTLDSYQATILELTPRTQEGKILSAIASIEDVTGGTVFPDAIKRAGEALRALDKVAKRHIILLSDCEINDWQVEIYEPLIEEFHNKDDITFSIIGLGLTQSNKWYEPMRRAAQDLGGGELYTVDDSNMEAVIGIVTTDITAPRITDVNIPADGFNPIIYDGTSSLIQNLDHGEGADRNKLTVKLHGFYGVKVRSTADLILVGDYEVPLYAQWKCGKGTVGSFMCDLNGNWSSDFINDANGRQFVKNVVNNLMPVENIRPNEMRVNLQEENYINHLSVSTPIDISKGERIEGKIINMSSEEQEEISLNVAAKSTARDDVKDLACYVTSAMNEDNKYTRCDFIVKQSGVYKIELIKYKADGTTVTYTTYKSFAYSAEYVEDSTLTELELIDRVEELASRGNGSVIKDLENPTEVFDGFITAKDRSFDPRFLFMILALILFLADIAVRKFKFKWPHELIREYKAKKAEKK